jgi:adenylate kinase family enzyme
MRPQRIAIVSTSSGCGKTTLGRLLANKLDAPFVELDALVHGPGWIETPGEALRAKLAPLLEQDRWVVDGHYRRKLGDMVLQRADLIIWLDLPVRVWFPRLVWRTLRRVVTREVLWNGNRETFQNAVWAKDSLFRYALGNHRRRRAEWPAVLEPYKHVRLSSPREVDRFIKDF